MISVLLVVAAAVSLWLFLSIVRRNRTWTTASTAVLVIGLVYQLPTFLAKATNSVTYSVITITGERQPIAPDWTDSVIRFADLSTVAVSALLIVQAVSRKRTIRWSAAAIPLLGMLTLSAIATISTDYAAPFPKHTFMVMLVIIAAAMSWTSRVGVLLGGAAVAVAIQVEGAIVLLTTPHLAFEECATKCTFAGEIYGGAASHPNALGLILTISLPFLWLSSNGRTRTWFVGSTLLIVAMSGSRTSLAAAAATVLLLMLVARAKSRATWGRAVSGGVAVTAVSLIAALLPALIVDPTFATGRGRLWGYARELINAHFWFGNGEIAWARLFTEGQIGAAAAYSTHNQWIEVTLLAGFLGALLFGIFLVSVTWTGPVDRRIILAGVMMPVMTLSISERPLSFTLIDPLSWALVAIVMLAKPDGVPVSPKAPATDYARQRLRPARTNSRL